MITIRLLDEPVCPAFDFVAHSDQAVDDVDRPYARSDDKLRTERFEEEDAAPPSRIEEFRSLAISSTISTPNIAELTSVSRASEPDLAHRGMGSGTYRSLKRLLDIVVATCGLVVSAPLMAILSVLIRLDSPGPVFFRQLRVGEGGRLFTILKLRTMHELESSVDKTGDSIATELDRVTRVGRYLRRWSLDEVPQFINVLRGEMSVVGPRPERPEIVLSHYRGRQYQRFLVPQGMTGWWQVTERGRTRLCHDTESDLYYLSRASVRFDLKILLMTLPALVRQARGV